MHPRKWMNQEAKRRGTTVQALIQEFRLLFGMHPREVLYPYAHRAHRPRMYATAVLWDEWTGGQVPVEELLDPIQDDGRRYSHHLREMVRKKKREHFGLPE